MKCGEREVYACSWQTRLSLIKILVNKNKVL